jgi:drug/metabolite transporter (DMT)-like permease
MIDLNTQRYALIALLAAGLFGVSAPLAKLLTGTMAPGVLAGLLYLGSGIALALLQLGRLAVRRAADESPLRGGDAPWLMGAIFFGGILGPLFLMWGLQHTTGAHASLLLGLEGIFTALLAALAFHEAIDRRVWIAAVLMVAASAVLVWPGAQGNEASWLGMAAVVAACSCWAIDNNVTRPISSADPVQITCIKGLAAGAFNLLLALSTGGALPDWLSVLAALAIGAVSYGLSLVLFILALRHLGSARTAAHFGSAPFFGAAFAIALGEPVTVALLVAMALMALATWLVLTERHEHEHTHEPMAHEHYHEHDAHHQHAHDFPWDARQGHSHRHGHAPMKHKHPHLPDLHHRHGHGVLSRRRKKIS